MTNFLDSLKVYAQSYTETSREPFGTNELAKMASAKVVKSEYGLSAEITLKAGGVCYMPMSRDSSLTEGTIIDLTKVVIITLERSGEVIRRMEESI